MEFKPLSEDSFDELNCLREKAAAAVNCIAETSECPRNQTLTYIASDYLISMGKMIQAMAQLWPTLDIK